MLKSPGGIARCDYDYTLDFVDSLDCSSGICVPKPLEKRKYRKEYEECLKSRPRSR